MEEKNRKHPCVDFADDYTRAGGNDSITQINFLRPKTSWDTKSQHLVDNIGDFIDYRKFAGSMRGPLCLHASLCCPIRILSSKT